MSRIALISCTKSKQSTATWAALLYDSSLFRKSLLYALGNSDACYVLSAKYGLTPLNKVIEPYDLTLKNLTTQQKIDWGETVGAKLKEVLRPRDELILLCGQEYSKPIINQLRSAGVRTQFLLDDLPFGKRLQKLTSLNSEPALTRAHSQFYEHLRTLYIGQNGGRLLKDCTGKLVWPKRGLYFFLEPDEILATRKYRPLIQRVTRVGTHAVSKEAKSTLWNRLSTHRGGSDGTGSHRSSIFRLHVGAALARRYPSLQLPSWGVGSVASQEVRRSEAVVEQEVSRILGQTRVLWLDIPDDAGPHSDRSYLERNAIGVLSRYGVLHPSASAEWLGTSSNNINIAISGLWNLDHLYTDPHPQFIEVLSTYVAGAIGEGPTPSKSIAPSSWYSINKVTDSAQMNLAFDGPPRATPDS